ncbi:MAG: hypothetical protein ACK4VY_05525 [Brevundimonas sp.]
MIVALLLLALIQDGPLRTAPAPDAAQERPATAADPGPRCTFGGRPVRSPDCPMPDGRIAPVLPTEAATAEEDDANSWDILTQAGLGQTAPGEGGYSRTPRAAAAADHGGVPGWAFTDPARWETLQCGNDGDAACRRQARNRLAMARASLAAEPPAAAPRAATAAPRCRMVMRRAEEGFGGSVSRVCGEEDAALDALDRLRESALPAAPAQPCDRPASYESQAAWIARCQALTPR